MSAEENKAVVHRIWEIINEGNLDAADELLATSYVYHGLSGRQANGPKGFKEIFARRRHAFPDFHVTVEEMIAAGDKVISRWVAAGTHKGDLIGIAPTNRQGTMAGITITRITGGRIAEDWESSDQLGILQQLGAIPPLGKGLFATLWWTVKLIWNAYTAHRSRGKLIPLH